MPVAGYQPTKTRARTETPTNPTTPRYTPPPPHTRLTPPWPPCKHVCGLYAWLVPSRCLTAVRQLTTQQLAALTRAPPPSRARARRKN